MDSRPERIKAYMLTCYEFSRDKQTGEIDCTLLAEDAADYFDSLDWLDDETHVVWDIAFDVATENE